MLKEPIVDVIIPAFNEEKSIGKVILDIPGLVRNIVVVNNNSTDQTKVVATRAGAIVLDEVVQGYGKACLTGMEYINSLIPPPEIIVFIDGDYSDYPEEILQIILPIIKDDYDMVIGSRVLGNREKGSMTVPQIAGNWLATTLMKWIYQARYTDLGPFRAIKWKKLKELGMRDQDYGWTIEMQIKAAKNGLRFTEVPVNYKNRIGVSKVSGTIKGTILAGYKILLTVFKYW